MVIEAGVAAGYVIAWAVRKARRIAGGLDAETDEVIDTGLERLHEVVVAKLGGHPVLEDLEAEAASGDGEVSELTRQQVELALTAAARKDELFGRSVMELVGRLREPQQAAGGSPVVAGAGSAIFAGAASAHADHGGIAFGQVAGDVHLDGSQPDPPGPGRLRH